MRPATLPSRDGDVVVNPEMVTFLAEYLPSLDPVQTKVHFPNNVIVVDAHIDTVRSLLWPDA